MYKDREIGRYIYVCYGYFCKRWVRVKKGFGLEGYFVF